MKKFTVSEVRDHAEWLSGVAVIGTGKTCHMLRAFADMLETREKAVPVAVVKDSDALYTGWLSWTGEPAPPETKLYTHSAPSGAERLVEALRNLVSEWVAIADDGDATLEDSAIGYRACANRLSAMLTAHSAQAQPPANLEKMPRMEQLRRFVKWERANNPERTHIAEWALRRIAYLEAQPPAASVPDVMDDYREGIQQIRAVLAAQESRNG